VKSFVELSRRLLLEIGRRVGVAVDRDILTFDLRCAKEGDSFLTIALPAYCQSLERALDRGQVISTDWYGPSWAKSAGGLPLFLGGFLDRLFDATGYLRHEIDSDVVLCLRQFLLVRKKVWAVANERRQWLALESYIKCEQEISDDVIVCGTFREVCARVLLSIVGQSGGGFDPLAIKGQHGPGATAEALTPNKRWNFPTWSERLERVFPHGYHAYPTEYTYWSDPLHKTRLLSEDDEQPVKVVFVPKTMKTPRVIAIEPSYAQYMQQGIMRWLTPLIESGPLTKGRINFRDQSINQRLAVQSSSNGRLATVDMSEASDRVSIAHVRTMLASHAPLLEAVFACRTPRALLPNGQVVVLRKFASMGSALCFPMEALAFFCAIVSARIVARKGRVTRSSVERFAEDVYVYGDDLLFPADEAPEIVNYLESLGFKVNRHKSFWTGRFRESCGVDAYDGVDVTPAYVRFNYDPKVAESVVSWVASANQLYQKGFWATVRWMREEVENTIGPLPFSDGTSPLVHWRSFSNCVTFRRWNKRKHRYEERGYVPTTSRRADPLEGIGALHKCLRLVGAKSIDRDHLATTAKSWSLRLETKWAPANYAGWGG